MNTAINKQAAMTEQASLPESFPPGHRQKKKPVVASLMSAFLPGFGQLYNGQINKALWLFWSFCFLVGPGTVALALWAPPAATAYVLALSLAIAIALWLFGVSDAWRVASNLPTYRVHPWQTSGMYVTVFVVCALLVLPLLIDWVRTNQVRAFSIPSASMTPSLLPGDYVFADMRYNCPDCPNQIARGDVSIFIYPDDRTRFYVKRIIGLPGDSIGIKNGSVSVNGELLNRTDLPPEKGLIIESIGDRSWPVLLGNDSTGDSSFKVSPGHVFVLGDNRQHSRDSRQFGMVPLSDVVGRVRQIWFSSGPDGIRWDRIGQALAAVKE